MDVKNIRVRFYLHFCICVKSINLVEVNKEVFTIRIVALVKPVWWRNNEGVADLGLQQEGTIRINDGWWSHKNVPAIVCSKEDKGQNMVYDLRIDLVVETVYVVRSPRKSVTHLDS